MSFAGDAPRADLRLIELLESHLESRDLLGVDVGHGEEIIDFLARISMGDVESLLGRDFDDADRERILQLVENRKGELDGHELPASEARDRERRLESMRRSTRERRQRKRRRTDL